MWEAYACYSQEAIEIAYYPQGAIQIAHYPQGAIRILQPRNYLVSVALGLHAFANHRIIHLLSWFRSIDVHCDDGWILFLTFRNIGIEGLHVEILF
jgi:hypothetical protein